MKKKEILKISANQMAKNLIDANRIILMNEDTNCGNEILCTEVAKRIARKTAYDMIEESKLTKNFLRICYWQIVINEIENY